MQFVSRDSIVSTFWTYAQASPIVHILRHDLVLIQAFPVNEAPLNAFLIKLGTIPTEVCLFISLMLNKFQLRRPQHHFCNESRLHLFLNIELPQTVDLFNPNTQYHVFVAGYGIQLPDNDEEDDMTQLLYLGTSKYRSHSCSEPASVIFRLYFHMVLLPLTCLIM